MKALVVAGTHSGCGKTTVTLGLLYLLKSLGYRVQAFKVGPDYIDQGLHGLITERPSRNLDLWMMGEEGVRESFIRNSSNADVAIVEGVMGLFDGPYGTWKVARVLGIPILLVMDSYGMAETIGPMAKGIYEECQNRGISLAGVIISKVGSEKHLKRIEGALPIPLLGYLPRDKLIEIPSRHLGLHVAEEGPIKLEALERLREHLSHSLDMDRLFGLSEIFLPPRPNPKAHSPGTLPGTIAVPRDKAFCFYYQDNLDTLEEMGFQITFFSPLEDPYPPKCDGIYIGGGYPEVYARELSQNKTMLKAIKELSFDKVPIYGECGGLIYLSGGIKEKDQFHELVGVFPFVVEMKQKVRLGYREIEAKDDFFVFKDIKKLRGHEFHYTDIIETPKLQELKKLFNSHDQDGNFLGLEGYSINNTVATYIHTYFSNKIIRS